jgi:hypothetical protein
MKNPKESIDACLTCLVSCEACIHDCLKNNHLHCIALCRDCADICALCAKLEARNSIYVHELHVLCAKVCKDCAIECAKHANELASCKTCAEACQKCEEACHESSIIIV